MKKFLKKMGIGFLMLATLMLAVQGGLHTGYTIAMGVPIMEYVDDQDHAYEFEASNKVMKEAPCESSSTCSE